MKPVKILFILVLISFSFFLPKDSVYPLTEVSINDIDEEIPLDGNPRSIAINPFTDQAVVTSVQPNKVSIVDLNTETVLSLIPAGKMPLGVAVDSGFSIALVTNSLENTISFIDLETRQAIHKLSVGRKPLGIAINEKSHIGLVTNYMDNSVSIIDLQNPSVLGTISVGKRPIDVAVDSELNLALVVNALGNSVSIIDLGTYNVRDEVSVGKKPIAISINTETHLAAVANTSGHSVTLINLEDGKITHIPVDKFPTDVAINPLDNRALVIFNRGSKLAYIDLSTNAFIDYYNVEKRSTGVAVNPFTNIAAVIDDKTDSITLIQLPNPVPEISSLNPGSVPRESTATRIIIKGKGFLKTSTASFLQPTPSPLTIDFIDNHHLEATIPENLLTQPGTYYLVVTNPAPEGGESNTYEFIVGNPKPVLSKLVPEETTAGIQGMNLRVHGEGFFNNTTVYINDKPTSFTLISEKELQLYLTTQDLEAGTTLNISAFNHPPGGGQSNSLPFRVKNPLPSLVSLNPLFIIAGSPDFTLTLTGDNFVKSSKVVFNGQEFSPTSAVKDQIKVTIPAAAVVTPGTYSVKANNPPPGGGDSNSLPFTAKTPLAITGFSPAQGPVGTVVTINGTGFDAGGLRVSFNGILAVVSNFTHSSITSSVPMGATTGPITVSTAHGAATTSSDFKVNSLYDFNISVTPQNIKAAPGSDITYTVSATGNEGFSALISLSIQGLPDGFSALFSPKTITSGQSSTLIITACDCTLSTPASMTIKGSATLEGKVVTRSAQVSLDLIQPGMTSLIGRVLDTERNPLRNVTILLGDSSAFTDESGNFLLENPPTGDQVILIDGSSASTESAKYPTIPITMTIVAGQTNSLPYVPHLHAQKHYNFTPINRSKETKAEDPEIPGLQLRIPAGVDIVGWDGEVNTKVSMTRVPIDALAVPPPPSEVQANSVMMFYFGKVGGGTPTVPIPITMPNDLGLKPGEKADLWYFDESPNLGEAPNEWRKAGTGTVSADGKTITTDPGVGIPRFCCGASLFAMQQAGEGTPMNPPNDRCEIGGNSVDPSTGIFIHEETDLVLPGRIPIAIKRSYRTLDSMQGPFGSGTYFGYNWLLRRSGSMVTLILPGNSQIPFQLQPNGIYINNSQPSFLGAKITYNYDGTAKLRMKDGFSYKFDSNGLLIQQTDRNGNKLTFIRGFAQDVTKVVAPDGRELIFTIQEGFPNLIRTITDPIGREVKYDYLNGRLERVTNPEGGVTRYEYDDQGRMVSIIDLRGNRRVRISYDANGRACQEEYADGGAYKFYYITVDQTTRPWAIKLLAEAKAGGPITVPPCSSAASNSRITYAIVVDPNGNPTTYRFNNSQKIVSVTNAEGQTTLINVNPITNLVTSRTDALGRTTKYTYDNKGNMKSMTDPAENTTAFEYEPNFNKPVTITDALGQVTSLGYDGRGNLTSITDAMGYTTTIVYDQFGQFIAITDPMDNGYTFEYDDKGNLIASIDPLGNKITRSYDAVSRLIEFTDPNGRNAIFDYDSMDRIRRVQDSLGKETTFDYDLNGNLLFITDANKNKRGYHYDVKNRLESTTDPLARTETYSYDFNDNFISVKDKKSETTFYTYDGLNRMIKATYADTSTVDHIYDPVGRLTRAEDSVTGPIDYAYTTFGCGTCARTSLDRIIQETTPLGIIKYTYDEIGRRKTMSVVGGSQVDYRYDKNGRLTEVSQTGLGTVKVDYDKAGRRVLLTLPNGVTTSYVYDKASQLLNMKHSTANAALEDLIYTNDAASNRISFDRISPQGELPKAATAAYNAANQMLNFADDNLTYDANGNLIEKRGASGTTTYTWDTRNQLIGINGPRIVANFKYDALGRRTVKTVNGKTMKYLYDGIDIHAEIDEGVVTATYLRGLNIDEAFARITEAGLRYYHADGLGSSIQLSDQNGAPTTIYSYDPFGNAFPSGAESDNPFQYTGRENDGTGLFYYRARYYSPELQRFISQDRINITTLHLPFEPYNYFTLSSISDEEAVKKYLIKYSLYHPETLNQYLYVYNNSTSHRDPTGEFSQFVLGAVAVILIVAEVVHLIHWSLHPQEELEAHLEKALPEPIDPLKEPPPEGPTTKKPPKQKPPKKSYCPTKKVWRPGK